MMFRASLAGFQTIGHSFRMKRQQVVHLLYMAIITIILICSWSLWSLWQSNPQQVKAAIFHVRADLFSMWRPDETIYHFTHANGQPGSVTAGHVRTNPAFRQARDQVISHIINSGKSGLWVAGTVILLLQLVYWIGGRLLMRKRILDGAEIVSARQLNKITHRRRPYWKRLLWRDEPYRIAGIEWPYGSETLHMLINGSTGSGKTTEMSNLIDQIRTRGQKAIIYDKMGSYIPPFYDDRTDIILNPLDERSANWDIFTEAQHDSDFDMMAAALIPEHKAAPDPFWADAARSLFSSAAATLWKTGKRDIRKLLQLLINADLKELATVMEGTVAQSIVDPDIHRTALSVRTVLTTRLRALFHLKHDAASFSIREWVQNEKPGILFISSQARVHETLRAMIATQLEIALVSLLSMPADRRRRIWTFIDELPTLHRIPSLVSALSESRQFGGCVVLGTQVNSALRSIYGKDDAETILGNCNTRLLLHTPDETTAKEGERTLGLVRRRWMARNVSYGENKLRDGVSYAEREETVPAVPASVLMALPELHGILKMPRDLPPARVRLKPKNRKAKSAHFIPAERTDPHTGEVYAVNPTTGAITDAATAPLTSWQKDLDVMQPGLFEQLTRDAPVEDHEITDGTPTGGTPAGGVTAARKASTARVKVTEKTQVDVKLSTEEMYHAFGFDKYTPTSDVPAHFGEAPPPDNAPANMASQPDDQQPLLGLDPAVEDEDNASSPVTDDLSAYHADNGNIDNDMTDQPQWNGSFPTGPAGHQGADMPEETSTPAPIPSGKTQNKPHKAKVDSAPMGQSNASIEAETTPSAISAEHQAALDFQAPTEGNSPQNPNKAAHIDKPDANDKKPYPPKPKAHADEQPFSERTGNSRTQVKPEVLKENQNNKRRKPNDTDIDW